MAIFSCSTDSTDTNTDEIQDENLPTLITVPVTFVTDNSAKSGGDVIDEGSSTVTNKGVCWSTNQNPTLADHFSDESSSGPSFISQLTDLLPATLYYARSYAKNSSGIAYGNQVEFTIEMEDVNAPCSPTNNTINHQGQTITFGGVQAGENHNFYGNYGVFASGLRGDLRVDFSHVPETGIYAVVSDFSLNQTLNECKFSATIDQGYLNAWCTSAPSPGKLIYVNKLAQDSYDITFCDMEFSCLVGYNNYNFTTDGNITD